MLFVRILFDKPDNSVDITTGDEISMVDVIKGLEECTGTFTINGYGISYVIDMEKVARWYPIRLRLGELDDQPS